MPNDPVSPPIDAAKAAEARRFLDRLSQRKTPDNHSVAEGVQVLAPRRRPVKRPERRDPVATVAMDPDSTAVKEDVVQAMAKIRGTLATLKDLRDVETTPPRSRLDEAQQAGHTVLDMLDRQGRDKVAYATFYRKGKMGELLDTWDKSWSVENTVGLLIDMSLAVRKARARGGDLPGEKGSLMGKTLKESRAGDHAVDKRSDWYQGLPENTPTHAGASATTAVLLLMLEDLDVPLPQVEALMNGVVRYWSGTARKISGNYHTAAEVWAVYNEHLESRLRRQWAANKQRIDAAAAAGAGDGLPPAADQHAPPRPLPPRNPDATTRL